MESFTETNICLHIEKRKNDNLFTEKRVLPSAAMAVLKIH